MGTKNRWGLTVMAALIGLAAYAQDKKPSGAPTPPAPGTVGATMTSHVLVNVADLKWTDGPPSLPPGAKVAMVEGDPKVPNALFTLRLKFPANYKIMPHSHPADEHVTVISGAFWMGMGEKFEQDKMKEINVGGFAVMPVGHRHFAMTQSETVIQLHGAGPWGINYVNPADDPRNQAKAKAIAPAPVPAKK